MERRIEARKRRTRRRRSVGEMNMEQPSVTFPPRFVACLSR